MKKNFGLHAAYYIVATGFTLWLITLLLAIVEFIRPSGTIDIPVSQVRINFPGLIKGNVVEKYKGDSGDGQRTGIVQVRVPDTLRAGNKLEDAAPLERPVLVMYQPLHLFKGFDMVPYQFMRIRALLWVIAWQLFLYQLFLVLYDIKRSVLFTEKNVRRMKRAAYLLFALYLLSAVTFEFNAHALESGGFGLADSNGIALARSSLIYVFAGFLFLAFSEVFRKRRTAATEADKI